MVKGMSGRLGLGENTQRRKQWHGSGIVQSGPGKGKSESEL